MLKKQVINKVLLSCFWIIMLSTRTLSAQVILYDKTSSKCNHEKNILFNKSSNNIQIVVEGIKCCNLKVTVDSGQVIRTGCTFSIQPTISTPNWEFPVFVKYKNGCDTLWFLVIDLPEPSFGISGMSELHNRTREILNLDSLVLKGFCGDSIPVIDSFRVCIKRGNELLFQENIEGNIFNESVKTKIKRIVSQGDIFEVSHVSYSQNDKSYVTKSISIIIRI